MYCPKCDREFGSVQSRCPECKSWLRPASGAAPASAGLAAPVALAAPVPIVPPPIVDDEQETCPVDPPASPAASPLPALSRPSGSLPPPPELPSSLMGRSSGWDAPVQNPILGDASPPPLTWQPQQPVGQMVAASAPTREKPPMLLDSTVAVVVDEEEEEDEPASPSPLALTSPRTLWTAIGVLTTCLAAFLGYLLWQSRTPAPAQAQPSPSISRDAQRTGLTALAQGQQLYLEKNWSLAYSQAEMARSLLVGMPGLSEAEQAPAKKFYRQATMTYAKELAGQAKKALARGKYPEAIGLSQKSAGLYSKISDANRAQAQSLAIEGRAYSAQNDFVSAQRAFVKAADLDPKGGYQKLADEARRASSAGLQSRLNEAVQESEPQTPSLGDEQAYPQGGPVTVRPSSASGPVTAPAEASSVVGAQPSSTASNPNKRRRYRTRPRSTSRPGGQLPSYNDGR